MKKISSILAILAFFALIAPNAKAQLTIFNLTACPVLVSGSYNYSPNPCVARQCQTSFYSVPAGGSTTISGNGNCPSPSFPPPPANFVDFTVIAINVAPTTVSLCGNPINRVEDCQKKKRTVQIFNNHFGAIY